MFGLISAGLGLAGALLGNKSQKKQVQAQAAAQADTNAMNMEMAREANAYNREMFDIQRADQQRYFDLTRSHELQDRQYQLEDRQWLVDNMGTDFNKLRDDALAAGFNPLTALGAAGGSYNRGSVGGLAPVQARAFAPSGVGAAEYVVPQIGVSSSAFIGDTASAVVGAVRDYASMIADRDTQTALMQQEHSNKMEQIKTANTAFRGAGYSLPKIVANTATESASGVQPPKMTEYDKKPSLGIRIGGLQVEPDSGWSNAEEAEKRYADAGANIYGLGVLGADFRRTMQKELEAARRRNRPIQGPPKAPKHQGLKRLPSRMPWERAN